MSHKVSPNVGKLLLVCEAQLLCGLTTLQLDALHLALALQEARLQGRIGHCHRDNRRADRPDIAPGDGTFNLRHQISFPCRRLPV